jgi:proteasome lid subunit RPN8/RPN11
MLLPEPWNGSQVIELPNRSLNGSNSYTIWPDDVEVALGEWAHRVDQIAREAVGVWHTHPSGLIGPSRLDMQKRIDGVAYLVVSLGEKPVPTWF